MAVLIDLKTKAKRKSLKLFFTSFFIGGLILFLLQKSFLVSWGGYITTPDLILIPLALLLLFKKTIPQKIILLIIFSWGVIFDILSSALFIYTLSLISAYFVGSFILNFIFKINFLSSIFLSFFVVFSYKIVYLLTGAVSGYNLLKGDFLFQIISFVISFLLVFLTLQIERIFKR